MLQGERVQGGSIVIHLCAHRTVTGPSRLGSVCVHEPNHEHGHITDRPCVSVFDTNARGRISGPVREEALNAPLPQQQQQRQQQQGVSHGHSTGAVR